MNEPEYSPITPQMWKEACAQAEAHRRTHGIEPMLVFGTYRTFVYRRQTEPVSAEAVSVYRVEMRPVYRPRERGRDPVFDHWASLHPIVAEMHWQAQNEAECDRQK